LGSGSSKEFLLLALSNDTNNTGYVVYPLGVVESSREAPPFVRQVFDSFELITPSTPPPIAAPTIPQQLEP